MLHIKSSNFKMICEMISWVEALYIIRKTHSSWRTKVPTYEAWLQGERRTQLELI